MRELTSDLALRVYRQVFLGIDKPLGYTLERADNFEPIPVKIPVDITWFVRHHDSNISDRYLPTLVEELKEQDIPGLSLASCRRLTDAGMRELSSLAHLETLDLFNTKISDEGIRSLTELRELKSLNLAGTRISDAGVELLQAFGKLEKLHLGWTEIGDAALEHLAGLKTLRMLELRGTKITDSGMKILSKMSWLETLGLQETEIGDAGVENLKPLASSLIRLYLGYTRITDKSLDTLKMFAKLRTLMLRATKLSRDHDTAIKETLRELGDVDTGPDGIQEGLIR